VPQALRPPIIGMRAFLLRAQLARFVRKASRSSATERGLSLQQLRRERRAAREMVDRRIDASRKVAEFASYERLFSLWHVLHLPLFFMLLIAGIVHVISVHVY
jgi:hypothetical protein